MAFGSYQEGARVRSDFREEGGAFLATIPVPTFAAYQLDVIVAGHLVSVRGEGTSTAFRRSLDLPANADPDYVTASLTDGVLELRAPRKISLPHQVWVETSDGPISAMATAGRRRRDSPRTSAAPTGLVTESWQPRVRPAITRREPRAPAAVAS
jgi:hypothetical protein